MQLEMADSLEAGCVDDGLGQYRSAHAFPATTVLGDSLYNPPILAPISSLPTSTGLGSVDADHASPENHLAGFAVGDACRGPSGQLQRGNRTLPGSPARTLLHRLHVLVTRHDARLWTEQAADDLISDVGFQGPDLLAGQPFERDG